MSPEDGRARPAFPGLLARSRVLLEWLAVGLIASLAVVLLARSPLSTPADRALYDQLTRLNARAPSDKVLLVGMDDASLASLGAWPWPRATHAALIDRLTAAGVAAVAYDVMFLEPDPTGGDGALATALHRSGRTAIPVLQVAPGEGGRAVRTIVPLQGLAAGAAALGQVNIAPDGDGVVRRVAARVAMDGTCWPQLSLAALQASRGATSDPDCTALAAASRATTELLAPPPELVPFAGPPGHFRTVSAAAVVRGEVPSDLLKGRIVLVGATAAGLGDRHSTTVSGTKGAMAGVELQANLLDAALSGARMREAAPLLVGALSVAAVWGLMLCLMGLAPRLGLLALGALVLTALAGSFVAFRLGWWASPFPAAAGLLLAYPLWSWRRLALTSDALGREIDRFQPEEGRRVTAFGADPLSHQMSSLEFAAGRLRDLHRLVSETLSSLPDPTVSIDGEGVIWLANELASKRSGQADVVGQSLAAWLETTLGPAARDDVLAAFSDGASTLEVVAADGAHFEVARSPIHGLGPGASWIVRLVDVSAIRQAVRQREDALQLLTHDIRAPFASISALVAQPAAVAAPDFLQRVDAYAVRGRALAESYVQFSRAENADWRPDVFDLRDAAIDAADEIWSQAQARGVEIQTLMPDEEALVLGDRALLTRAVMNLVDNAVRYSPAGQTVSVACRVVGDKAVCEVRDHGPGVDPALMERLFQRFSRGADAPATTGAGLGLAIVSMVARRMGGIAVHAASEDGGALFRIALPLHVESD